MATYSPAPSINQAALKSSESSTPHVLSASELDAVAADNKARMDAPASSTTSSAAPSASPYDTAGAAYFKNANMNVNPDENKIRQSMQGNIQGQLDTIDSTYASTLTDQLRVNQNDMGRTRATDARSGTLGSDFGNADLGRTDAAGKAAVAALTAQRDAKKQAVYQQLNTDVQNRLQAQKQDAEKNSVDYLNFLKGQETSAQDHIKNLGGSGVKIEDLTDEEANHLMQSTGMSQDELKAALVVNQPKADILHSEVAGNKYIQVTKNPSTGALQTDSVDLGQDIPQGYTPEKLANGQLIFIPKDGLDPTKPLEGQILTYNGGMKAPAGPKAAKTVVSGSMKYSQDDLAQIQNTLTTAVAPDGTKTEYNPQGQDGYVDPDLYQHLYQNWIQNGGIGKDFLAKFPPKQYINPANQSLPTYLRSKTQTIKGKVVTTPEGTTTPATAGDSSTLESIFGT